MTIFAHMGLCAHVIEKNGNEDQKAKFLPGIFPLLPKYHYEILITILYENNFSSRSDLWRKNWCPGDVRTLSWIRCDEHEGIGTIFFLQFLTSDTLYFKLSI